MKRRIYKSALLLILPALLASGQIFAQGISKDFHKEYTAGPNTTLDISNKYGDVSVETSDANQVIIDVKVTVDVPNKERAEKLLSYINVDFSQDGDLISAKTIIDDKFNFSGWGGPSRRFSINYNVKMPKSINFTLANRYGNSELEEIRGLVKLDIKYGNITAVNLARGNEKPLNSLSLAYGKGEITAAGWLDIVVRYSGDLQIDKSQALLLDSKYSKMQLGEASSLVGESKYDNIRIEKINNMVLDAGYSDIVVETLNKKLKFDGGYGALTVEDIPAGFESLETNTRYLGLKLGIDSNASYNLDAKLSYGELKFDESNFQNQKRIVQNTSSETSGIVGKESSPSATVKVTASYGSVRLE
ncbi:MAG: hypothetical protein Q8868_10160 [Bacteroidota bacterium]|nr:hypothetical protein [Bacteroidota bacterium]